MNVCMYFCRPMRVYKCLDMYACSVHISLCVHKCLNLYMCSPMGACVYVCLIECVYIRLYTRIDTACLALFV